MPKFKMRLTPESIGEAIKGIKEYQERLNEYGDEIARRLADKGYSVAFGIMSGHVFSGETLGGLEVIEDGENRYILYAQSKALLFFEFGAGVRYAGTKHPWASELGYGPGSYPGSGHWNDPNGWWFPTDDPRLIIRTDKNGQGWAHSYGNKPYMPFYLASKTMREDLVKVAREVFQGGDGP